MYAAILGCAAAPEQAPDGPPALTGFVPYDAAVSLAVDEPADLQADVYLAVARRLADDGLIDRAERLLSYVDRLLAGSEFAEAVRVRLQAEAAVVAHAIAARDATRAAAVDERTAGILDVVDRSDDAALQATVAEILFPAVLDNPNAAEGSIRRTLDLVYLIPDDAVRARALVSVAEQVEGRADRIALNPLVQQAIALVPALEDPLTAMTLGARLARLSAALDRRADIRSLTTWIVERSELGVVIDSTTVDSFRRMVANLVALDGDGIDAAERVVANAAPQRVRALAYGWYADALWASGRFSAAVDAFDQGYRLTGALADVAAAAESRATLVRIRAARNPGWDAASAVAALLAEVRLGTLPGAQREAILVDAALAYVLTNRPELTDRLRGLIATGDELARINIAIGEALVAADRAAAARGYLNRVSEPPPPQMNALVDPALRSARAWHSLGDYDRAVITALDVVDADLARFLATIPVSHSLNPATRGQLDRRVADS